MSGTKTNPIPIPTPPTISPPTTTIQTYDIPAPPPRSRRSSHRSTRSGFVPSLLPSGWRGGPAPGLQAPAQPLAASVSTINAAAPASSGSSGNMVAARGPSAAVVANRAIQAADGGAKEVEKRRRAASVGDDDNKDKELDDDIDGQRIPHSPSSRPPSLYSAKARRPSISVSAFSATALAPDTPLFLSVDTQTTAAATIIQPSASSSSSSWLISLTRAKGKQAVRPNPTSPIAEGAAEDPSLMPTTPSNFTAGTSIDGGQPTSTGNADEAVSSTQPSPSETTPLQSPPEPPALHVQPPTPAVAQGLFTLPPLPQSSPASTKPAAFVPLPPSRTHTPSSSPAKKRSWFASPVRTPRSSVPSSPTKASSSSTLASLSTLAPAPTFTAAAEQVQVEVKPEDARVPTPPPLPKTPPPTYPLELQLAVDSVVDATAMHPAVSTRDNSDDEVDEPPVYTPTNRVGSGKGKRREARTVEATGPVKEVKIEDSARTVAVESGKETQTTSTGGGMSSFMLALPLLGRAKVPLGIGRGGVDSGSRENLRKESESRDNPASMVDDVGNSGAVMGPGSVVEGSTKDGDPPSQSTSPLTSPEPTRASVTQAQAQAQPPTQTDSNLDPHAHDSEPVHPPSPSSSSKVPDDDTSATRGPLPSSSTSVSTAGSSWWDYVGWGLALPIAAGAGASTLKGDSAAAVNAQEVEAVRMAREAEVEEAERRKAVEEQELKAAEDEERRKREEEDQLAKLVEQVQGGEDATSMSITTTTTTTVAPTGGELSTWFSPWAWYSSSAPSTSLAASHTGDEQDVLPDSNERAGEKLDADTPLAVDTTSTPPVADAEPELESAQSQSPEPVPEPVSEPVSEPINPVAASMLTHKSSWAAFFSSHAFVNRTLGYGVGASARAVEDVKRDENGVEVMEVDFDDGGEESAVEGQDGAADERGRDGGTKPVGGELVLRPSERAAALPPTTSTSTSSPASTPAREASPSPRVATATTTSSSNAKTKAAPLIKISAEVKKDSRRLSLTGSGKSSAASSAANTPVRGRSPAMAERTSAGALATTTTSTLTMTTNTTDASKATTTVIATTTTASTLTSTTTQSTTQTTPPTRPSSPTPTPKKPLPPPNLVLPTWADTFGVPPRNVPPPPKPKPKVKRAASVGRSETHSGVLGKTLHFMSGVLFAKDGHAAPHGSSQTQSPKSPSSRSATTKAKGKERSRYSSGIVQRTFSSGSGSSTSSSDDKEKEDKERLSLFEQDRRARFALWGRELPKAWSVVDGVDGPPGLGKENASGVDNGPGVDGGAQENVGAQMEDVLRGCRRVVVIGVHGWFPGAMIRSVLGEPTGTSTKFANMMEQALRQFEAAHGVQLDKVTKIPLEGDGTIARRVDKLYTNLQANAEWMDDLHAADAVLIATHSQGCVVSTHLLDQLIRDGHVVTMRTHAAASAAAPAAAGAVAAESASGMDVGGGMAAVALALGMGGENGVDGVKGGGDGVVLGLGLGQRKVQKVCVLALCGIHLGPLRYLSSSTLVGPYLQYFESTAARELFEFQNTESTVSKAYVAALNTILDHGIKVVYVASLNDQVVPIYSGLFTAVSHPLILRALYIDGDAYHSSDFLSNLLVLLLRILNAGMSDSGLLAHLSEATAGSLNGVGHSTAYEEVATYSLAVRYLFLANEGVTEEAKLEVEPFNAAQEQNDYEIPWSLRDIIADERVAYFFGKEIAGLRDAFREWHPKTTILRDLKRKLQPIQRLPSTFSMGTGTSKL